MKNVIALIPAIGEMAVAGSDPGRLCGRPLIYWNLEALQKCSGVDRVVVITDKGETEGLIHQLNFSKAAVLRLHAPDIKSSFNLPEALKIFAGRLGLAAGNTVLVSPVMAPFTTSGQFEEALVLYEKSRADILRSGVLIDPLSRFGQGEEPRPQMVENGAFFITSLEKFLEEYTGFSGQVVYYEMPAFTLHSLQELIEWNIAEPLMRQFRIKPDLNEGLGQVKLVVSDVDGVLTDGSMYYTEKGDEIKRFHTYDGMAFGLIKALGIKTALITSEDTRMVANRARKLKIDYLFQGRRHGSKLAAIQDICGKEHFDLSEVVYIGDDINCREALSAVGFAFCPANALPEIKSLPKVIQLQRKGGEGVVREVFELYIRPNFASGKKDE